MSTFVSDVWEAPDDYPVMFDDVQQIVGNSQFASGRVIRSDKLLLVAVWKQNYVVLGSTFNIFNVHTVIKTNV